MFQSCVSFTQVETCQEKIITLELKDPITNAPLSEEQLAAAKLAETTTISPSDDENSSIITVRSNASNNESMVRLHLANEDGEIGSDAQCGGTLGGSFLTAVQHHQPANVIDASDGMQTIVEVVNPLISGQGYANKIAVGRSNDDSSYPSFDPSDVANVSAEVEAAAAAHFDSLDAYTASELSLSDKMKNVLKELVRNERVRLSFSQSISEGEDSDSEQNDTDDDANEPLRHDSSDDESAVPISPSMQVAAPVTEENGNEAVIAQLNIVDEQSDSGNNDDIKNANIIDDDEDDFIYKNPNFLMAGDEIDASTSAQQSATTNVAARNQRDEKLKEKLLAELNVQPSGTDENRDEHLDKNPPTPPPIPPTPTSTTTKTTVTTKTATSHTQSTNDPDDDEDESSISVQEAIPSVPTSTIETSSKSDSISSTGSNKRKKRKSKARKK